MKPTTSNIQELLYTFDLCDAISHVTRDLDRDALPCYTTIDEVDPYASSIGGRMSQHSSGET